MVWWSRTAFREFSLWMGAGGLTPSAAGGTQGSHLIFLTGEAGSWDGRHAPSHILGLSCWSGKNLSICCREEASESNSLASSGGCSAVGELLPGEMPFLTNTDKQIWEKARGPRLVWQAEVPYTMHREVLSAKSCSFHSRQKAHTNVCAHQFLTFWVDSEPQKSPVGRYSSAKSQHWEKYIPWCTYPDGCWFGISLNTLQQGTFSSCPK